MMRYSFCFSSSQVSNCNAIDAPGVRNAIQVEKKGVVEKLQTLQDTCLQVQQAMDVIASLFEQIEKSVSFEYNLTPVT